MNIAKKSDSRENQFEAAELMDVLSATKKEDDGPGFFFRVRTENNRLHSVMWSSSSQRESLARYGDVVVFDLTYKTNSLKLPLAAFVGTDNHGKTVVFALALQLDETAPTMQWLFEQFKDL